MNAIWLLVLGAASSCITGTEHGRIRIGLYTDFQHPPPAAIRQAAREELAAIMASAGAVVDWRPVADDRLDQRWNAIATVRFRGFCDTSDLRVRPSRWVFGETHLIGGEIIPYIDIQCDAIRGFLAPTLNSLDRRSRTLAFGRAVARVLGHELYHILAKSSDHASTGIAKRGYTALELAAPEFWFQGEESQRWRPLIWASPVSGSRCDYGASSRGLEPVWRGSAGAGKNQGRLVRAAITVPSRQEVV